MKKVLFAIGFGVLLSACSSPDSGSGAATAEPPKSAAPAKTATAATTAAAPPSAATAAMTGAPAAARAGGGGVAGPATEAGAKTVIGGLQKATDQKAEFAKLEPSEAEIKELFTDDAVPAVTKHVGEMFSKLGEDKLEFKSDEPKINCASSDDVTKWTPEVEKHFPGGYKKLGAKLKGGHMMCKFKIGGVAFDSLVNIKGKWYYVGKPFRALKE